VAAATTTGPVEAPRFLLITTDLATTAPSLALGEVLEHGCGGGVGDDASVGGAELQHADGLSSCQVAPVGEGLGVDGGGGKPPGAGEELGLVHLQGY